VRFVIAGGVLAGAAAGLGAVFLGVAQSSFNDAEDAVQQNSSVCRTANTECAQVRRSFSKGNAFRNYAAMSFVGSGAFGAATLVLAFAPMSAAPDVSGRGLLVRGAW
jgi:hypothetical protein